MKKPYSYIIITALTVLAFLPLSAETWELITDRDGVKLYAKPDPATGLMEFMAVTVIEARMEVIGEVLRDVDNFSKWMSDCSGASLVKRISRNEMVIHMVLDPPLIEDRELVLRNRTEYDFDSGSALISFAADYSGGFTPAEGKVKVPVMEGYYKMDYLGRDRTKFCYRLKSDPGGSVPRMAAYRSMRYYPFDTARRLKKMVLDPVYSRSAAGTPEEKEIESRMKNGSIIKKILYNRLSPFVRNREALKKIIDADTAALENIVRSGGTYESVERASAAYLEAYIDMEIKDTGLASALKKNAELKKAFIDMANTDCGAPHGTLEKMIDKYRP